MRSLNAYEVLNVPPTASREEIRKTYRTLVRRWHPDRFMEGPERDWANDKMAEINSAYHACMDGTALKDRHSDENTCLKQAEQLMESGEYIPARKLLISLNTRCAEWNYLFGAVLMHLAETEKALIYLTVAVHQNPSSAKYAKMRMEARRLNSKRTTNPAAKSTRRRIF